MISKKTHRLLTQFTRIAYHLRIVPWIWNNERGLIIPLRPWPTTNSWKKQIFKQIVQWKILTRIHIALRIFGILHIFVTSLSSDIKVWEVIISTTPCFLFITSIAAQIYFLTASKEIQLATNGITGFNRKLWDFYKTEVREDDDDGLGSLRGITVFIPIMIILVGLSFVSLLSSNFKSLELFQTLNFIPGYKILFGLLGSYGISVDIIVMLVCVLLAVSYLNSTSLWLDKHILRWKTEYQSRDMRKQLFLIYQTHKCLHDYITRTFSYPYMITFSCASLFIITSFYSAIFLAGRFDPSLVFAALLAGIFTAMTLYFILKQCNKVTNASELCLQIFSNQGIEYQGWDLDKRVLASCQPLYWIFGSFFPVKKTTFATTMKDFIMNYTITLLLTWRRQESDFS